MIKIRLEKNSAYISDDCCICGNSFDFDSVVAVAFWMNGKWEDYLPNTKRRLPSGIELGWVCEDCLEGGPEWMNWHLANRAKAFRKQAMFFEKLKKEKIDSPSLQDFKEALKERHREIFGEDSE